MSILVPLGLTLGSVLGLTALVAALRYGGSVAGRRRNRPAAPPLAAPAVDRDDEREESRLAAALLAGDLPMVWYRQRMAALAARDNVGHPLATPPSDEHP